MMEPRPWTASLQIAWQSCGCLAAQPAARISRLQRPWHSGERWRRPRHRTLSCRRRFTPWLPRCSSCRRHGPRPCRRLSKMLPICSSSSRKRRGNQSCAGGLKQQTQGGLLALPRLMLHGCLPLLLNWPLLLCRLRKEAGRLKAEVQRLAAENERLMELSNELRAERNRLAASTGQRPPPAAVAAVPGPAYSVLPIPRPPWPCQSVAGVPLHLLQQQMQPLDLLARCTPQLAALVLAAQQQQPSQQQQQLPLLLPSGCTAGQASGTSGPVGTQPSGASPLSPPSPGESTASSSQPGLGVVGHRMAAAAAAGSALRPPRPAAVAAAAAQVRARLLICCSLASGA